MIRVLFRQSPDAPAVDVLIDEKKHGVEAILQRAAERAGRQLEGKELEAHGKRYDSVRLEFAAKRAALKAKAEKR